MTNSKGGAKKTHQTKKMNSISKLFLNNRIKYIHLPKLNMNRPKTQMVLKFEEYDDKHIDMHSQHSF